MSERVPSPRVAGRAAFLPYEEKALSISVFHAMMIDVKKTPPTDFSAPSGAEKG